MRSLKGNKTELEAWHVEVQVSFNPIAYISKLDSDDMIEMNVRAKNSAKTRPLHILKRTTKSWVEKKFSSTTKARMRTARWPDLEWKHILVHGVAKFPEELELIKSNGVKLVDFHKVLLDLKNGGNNLRGQTGTDILDILLFYESRVAADLPARILTMDGGRR